MQERRPAYPAIVGTASALILIVSKYGFSDVLSTGLVEVDPSRVAAQIVSGIASSARADHHPAGAVHGLTTAAAIWECAAIGMAAAAGAGQARDHRDDPALRDRLGLQPAQQASDRATGRLGAAAGHLRRRPRRADPHPRHLRETPVEPHRAEYRQRRRCHVDVVGHPNPARPPYHSRGNSRGHRRAPD